MLLNRREWDADANNWVERGHEAWAQDEPSWGVWPVPESEVKLLPEVNGLNSHRGRSRGPAA
jgi:hypothetical protein